MSYPPAEPPDEFRKKPAERRRRKRRKEEEEEFPQAFSILSIRDIGWAPLGERIIILPDGRVIRIPAVPYFGAIDGS